MHRVYTLLLTFFITSFLTWGQNSVRYWFDQQPTKQMLSETEIDCSALSTGVHFAHFQISGADGNLSPVRSKAFLVMNEVLQPSSDFNKISFWFDQQASKQVLSSGSTEINCSNLTTGMHFAHFQIEESDGKLGPVRSQAFLVMNEALTPSSAYSGIKYWFDQQTAKTSYTSGSIDCSALTNGIHAVHFQLIDDKGLPCPVKTQFFVTLDFAAHQLYYWFDDQTTRNLMDIDGTEISVEGLVNGPHTLHAMLADAKGNIISSELKEANFTIICSDGNHVDEDADETCDVCHELISYTRSGLTEGKYGTLCLPKGGAASGATIYSVEGKRVDSSDNPTSLVIEEVTTLEPGKPYIFCAESDVLKVTYSGIDYSAEALAVNGLVGNYINEADVEVGKYLLYQNKLVKCGADCKINANRAYVDMDEVPVYEGNPSLQSRSIGINLGNTTGINLFESSEEKAQIFTPSGIRIPQGTKGIMIINGNKVVKQ